WHSLEVIGRDAAGNWQTENIGYSWRIIESNPHHPIVELFNLPENPTTSNSIDVIVGGDDVVAYKYRLDLGPWSEETPVSEHIQESDLALGQHSLEVLGRNDQNAWQADPTSYLWQIIEETQPNVPLAVLSNLPSSPTTSNSIDVIVGGDDVVAYKYRLDLGPWSEETPVSEHIQESDLAFTTHVLEVIAKNSQSVWQLESESTSFSWQVNSSSGGGGGGGSGGGGGGALIREPMNPSIVINDGEISTNQRNITLALSAVNMYERYAPLEMSISESAVLNGQEWITYSPFYNWTLSSGNELKVIYVRFRNQWGTSNMVSAQINLSEGQVLGTLEFRDGSLLKTPNQEAVYLIEGGMKHVFPHVAVYYSWDYPQDFSTVMIVSPDVLDRIPEGEPIRFRDGSLFRGTEQGIWAKDKTTVFYVECGMIRPIIKESAYQRFFSDPNWNLVVWVPDDLLDKFTYPLGDMIYDEEAYLGGCRHTFADGTLIKSKDSQVYEIVDGQRYHIKDLDELKQNYAGQEIKRVSEAVVNHYPLLSSSQLAAREGNRGMVLGSKDYRDGALIKGDAQPTIYMMEGGEKHAFLHQTVYEARNFPQDFNSVLTLPQTEVDDIPEGWAVNFQEGTLLREDQGGTIFKVEGGLLRPFHSAAVYQRINNDPNWELVKQVPNGLLDQFHYSLGPVIY
ncbi:hypothetical protein K9K85_02245, partial [Patescibacteria group bacterium]|nr:hypothetical protein [Patescibacteria group bacterium]